jgi:hypothetical protein
MEEKDSPLPTRPSFAVALISALLASGSMWFYMNRILVAQQVADAAARGRPRGNLSDLYPRWLGARELLRRGRNPYGNDITLEIQKGYYGRPIDPTRPDDPKDRQGFAYPVYVVFLLAPTVDLPFETVQIAFRWLLVGLAAGSVLLWLRVLRWPASFGTVLILVVLMLGWLPMVQGIKLQQLTLLVAALLAACGVCLVGEWVFLAGGLLALATIKPQLTWPLVLWLLLWAGSEWRSRRRFVFGFGLMMLLLLGGAELVLPGWLRMFVGAIGQYRQYTQNQSLLSFMVGPIAGWISGALCVYGCVVCLWRSRREPASNKAFGRCFALVLALTVVIVPMSALYNQVLLAPAILALVWSSSLGETVLPSVRVARLVGAILLVWPWIATTGLSLASVWLTPALRERLWPVPFYASFVLPVFVFGLALLHTWRSAPGLNMPQMTQPAVSQPGMTQPGMTQPRTLRDSAPAE